MTASVCTITRGREDHLRNLILGLTQQSTVPAELIIAYMQSDPYCDLPDTEFPIRQVKIDGVRTRLAAARNAAASTAESEHLVFLDVDCIPMPELVAAYLKAIDTDRCLMGDTRYLARDHHPSTMALNQLWHAGDQHPARHFEIMLGPGNQMIPEATKFWSLSFALTAELFWGLGGFDEIFEGYGGEDTDFAMRLDRSSAELFWVPDARAVHQWHAVEKPPITHLDDIVRNANLFYQKHGSWCMDYWLNQFASRGYINWSDNLIEILRRPSTDERKVARCDGSVRFS